MKYDIRRIRSRHLFATGFLSLVAVVSACNPVANGNNGAANSKDVPRVVDGTGSQQVVGIWFRGIHLIDPENEEEVVGIFVVCAEAQTHECERNTLELLKHGAIIGSFRSAREAAEGGRELAVSSGKAIVWVRALYGNNWEFSMVAPPATDTARGRPCVGGSVIGDADAGLNPSSSIVVLPSPLMERGVSVAVCETHGTSIRSAYPRDCSLTMFISWNDLEARTANHYVHNMYWFNHGQREYTEWSKRQELRLPPQRP